MITDLFKVVWSISGAEVTHKDLEEIALTKHWAKNLIYCDMEGFALTQDGLLVLMDECGSHVYPPEGMFKIQWLKNPSNE